MTKKLYIVDTMEEAIDRYNDLHRQYRNLKYDHTFLRKAYKKECERNKQLRERLTDSRVMFLYIPMWIIACAVVGYAVKILIG